jgi:putative transposase
MMLASPNLNQFSERLACQILSVNRKTLRQYRKKVSFIGPPAPRRRSLCQHALTGLEREEVLSVMNSSEFCDQPPAQIFYTLLSRGEYLCSVSTMHRLLRGADQEGERRQQRAPQQHAVPRLRAEQPNEVWTWDITKLATMKRGVYLSLYVVMDLFSRFIVAWMLSRKENSALSSQLIREAGDRYGIEPGQLTLHQDRGSPMTAHCYLDLLGELSITASHSRPRVSNDNPMSESQFKTMKYQPDYPKRFTDYQHAEAWCRDYVQWYNHDHHHSALAGYTPAQVFNGEYKAIAQVRLSALTEAYQRNPARFARGAPRVAMPPHEVFINPVVEGDQEEAVSGVNFPTLRRLKTT